MRIKVISCKNRVVISMQKEDSSINSAQNNHKRHIRNKSSDIYKNTDYNLLYKNELNMYKDNENNHNDINIPFDQKIDISK